MAKKKPSENLPVWDLSAYYKGIDDPRIFTDLKNAHRRALLFEKKYRGKITDRTAPAVILRALQKSERISQDASKPPIYAHLVHSTDSNTPEVGALVQKTSKLYTEIITTKLFFGLALASLKDQTLKSLMANRLLANYRNFFRGVLEHKPHRLTEPEEKILARKSLTGRQAFVRLFDEHMATRKFAVTIKGKTREMSLDKVLDLLKTPDRASRKAAAQGVTAVLNQDKRLLTFISNTLAEDKNTSDELARFKSPEESRHMSNEIDQGIADAMSAAISSRYGMVSDYYRLKKSVLGYKEIFDYDRYAPIGTVDRRFTFPQARKIVLDAFARFSDRLAEGAREFFDNGWIHARPMDGKRGGAYCNYGTTDRHPVVFMNYFGKIDDVSTLAHELGHGVNAYMMRKQTPHNYETPLVMAETASVFGEMLVFDDLKHMVRDRKERQALYMDKIERIFATVFRQHAMYQFEREYHAAIRERGEIPAEEIGRIWRRTQLEMYGKSVSLTPGYDSWWSYIPHFLHTPFYVYAYAFGELLVLSLYAMYKKEGRSFVPKYLKLMEAGGTATPQELLRPLGVDLRDRQFWLGGLDIIQEMVDEAKSMK